MALSLHHESDKHDKFAPGLTRSQNGIHFFQQQCSYNSGQKNSMPNSRGTESESGMTEINYNSKFLQNIEKHFPAYRNGQVYSADQFQDAFSNMGMPQDTNRGVNNGTEPSYYCPWNVDGPLEGAMAPTFNKDGDLGSSLNRSCGLNLSNTSSGFGTLDDLVSKIVEDDSSLFGSFNGTSENRHERQEGGSFEGDSGVHMNGMWSTGGEAATSTPASSKMRHVLDFDSSERNTRPADFLWDTSGSSSGSFLQDNSFLDNLYNVPGAANIASEGTTPVQAQQMPGGKQERFRYAKNLFNKTPLDANHMRDFEQNGAGDCKRGGISSPLNNHFFPEPMYDRQDKDAPSGSHHPMAPVGNGGGGGGGGPAASHQHQDFNIFNGQSHNMPSNNMGSNNMGPNNSLGDAAWALANLPDIPGIDKRILAQALVSQASNAFMNPDMMSNKDKLIDSLVLLSDKSQGERETGASGPPPHGASSNLTQPIGVMTQQHQQQQHLQQQQHHQNQQQHHQNQQHPNNSNSYPNGGTASINTWSNPSTPNSVADSTVTSASDNHGISVPNHRMPVFPQKGFHNKFPHQNGRGSSSSSNSSNNSSSNNSGNGANNHSPVMPGAFDKRSGNGYPGPSPPRPNFRGRGMPFPFPRPHHVLDPSGDAKPGSDRFPNGPFPLPEHLSAMERGSNNGTPFPKDFHGIPPHHRSHFFEEIFPHEYAGLPPFPSHLKFPHNLPPHLPPEAYDYYPPYDPYFQGRLAPSFFGPGDMFFDMLPPHFYGLPHFFPGFKPPRRTGPSNELHIRLEECYDQFKNLERERKKTEAELARQNPGKKVSSANNVVIPRLPSNPSRVDRLVVDSLREHARVLTLILKMEKLRGETMHANIHSNMDTWMEGIRKVQARRKEEIINATNRHRNGGPRYQEEKDVLALATSINELTTHTRRARTAMWCALQMSTKDVAMSTLHHLRPSELAAHDAASLHPTANPPSSSSASTTSTCSSSAAAATSSVATTQNASSSEGHNTSGTVSTPAQSDAAPRTSPPGVVTISTSTSCSPLQVQPSRGPPTTTTTATTTTATTTTDEAVITDQLTSSIGTVTDKCPDDNNNARTLPVVEQQPQAAAEDSVKGK